MELDREYKKPDFLEEEIDEMNDLHAIMGMQIMHSDILKILESELGKVHAVTIAVRKAGNDFISKRRDCVDEDYKNSTLQSKLSARIDYESDPINMLKKAKLDGALDCYDSGLFT